MIWGFFSRYLLQLIVSGLGITVLVGSCVMRDRSIEARGEKRAMEKVERAATRNVEKADKARAAAARVPDDKLFDRYTRRDGQ